MGNSTQQNEANGGTPLAGPNGSSVGITREHTVWCSKCNKWEQLAVSNLAEFKREVRRNGWTFRKGSWNCRTCSNPCVLPPAAPAGREQRVVGGP